MSMSIHEKLKIKTYLTISIIVAGAMHVLFGIYFAYIGIYAMAVLNVFDVVVYIITFFVNKAGKTRLASFMLMIKIMFFSLSATFLLGTSVNSHWFILIAALPAVLYLDFTKTQKACIVIATPMLINFQMFFQFLHPPLFDMYNNVFLQFLFINIIVFSIIFVVGLNFFITQRVAAMQSKEIADFKHMSNIDPLTELNNRRYAGQFFEKLDEDSQNMPYLFCLMDIDNFKSINDTYGHNIGDVVLAAVADILRQNTRQSDLVCRWGGEEFLVVFLKCDEKIGRKLLEKIRKAVEDEIIKTESGEISITITCGASVLTDSNDIEAVLEICDKNLYEGKRSGKNKVVF